MRLWMQIRLNRFMESVRETIESERGDTNFISIIIILGLVILLATVFMGFKDAIVEQVQSIMDGFTIK